MSRIPLLPETGKFYKTNLHCHTTNSDGSLTPAQLKELYKNNGYSAVAFSDHHNFYYLKELEDENFIPLASYELNYDNYSGGGLFKTCHICALAKDPENCTPIEGKGDYSIENINEAVRKLNENGFIVNLNHPVWSSMLMEEVFRIKGITAMEVFNSATFYMFNDVGDAAFYDLALKNGMKVMPIMTDDSHGGKCIDGLVTASVEECKACVMLKSDEFSYEGLIQSFINGNYYCTNGPLIHDLYIENDKLCIDCSPVRFAYLKSIFIHPWEFAEEQDGTMTHAQFDLGKYRNKSPYVRLQIMDANGNIAYALPYYF